MACYADVHLHDVADTAFETLLGHAIPHAQWDKNAALGLNDTVSQLGNAKMMNGLVSMDMAEALVAMVNGHFFKGAAAFIKGYFSGLKHHVNKNMEQGK